MANLIKISKGTNTDLAIIDFRDLFTIGAVTTKEARVLISSIPEIWDDGRVLTVKHPAGDISLKPDEVDDIDGNTWIDPSTPWDFVTFKGYILTFLNFN
jgi:hypothetical protein